MLILSGLTLILILGIVLKRKLSWRYDWIGIALTMLSGILLGTALFMLLVNHYSGKEGIEKYYALKETIEISRKNKATDIERASLVKEIAECNKDLASFRYYNDTIFDIFIPDELAQLPNLK